MSLSMFQRSVLALMATIEDENQALHGYDRPRRVLWVSRRSLELALGFDWRQFHTDKMNELIKVRRIEVDKDYHGLTLYALTEKGLSTYIMLGRIARSHMRFTEKRPDSQIHMFTGDKDNA